MSILELKAGGIINNRPQKVWEIREQIFKDELTQILYNRGIVSSDCKNEIIDNFLHPSFENDLHDPKLLPDYQIFEDRISSAITNKEKIGIFADYDADGIPGAAFLHRAFKILGIQSQTYIPLRENGYGFNKEGIDILLDGGCSLIISVDLGIKEFKNAEYIKSKNCDLIITDHHLPDDELPTALAVINPKIKNSRYPFKELSGAGVVFKLIQGLSNKYPKKIGQSFLKWNLDLIAISTISDVVPMVGENRVISKFGLISLSKTKNIGLRALYDICGIDKSKITSYEIGFMIAPRINAPGRIDHATKSLELLITEDKKEALELSRWLNEKNQLRQSAMEQVEIEAIKKIEKYNITKNKIIILHGDWPKGVIGPSASRLVEKYSRPVVLLARDEEGFSGSCRSISNFNIIEALQKVEKYLDAFGGHKGAAGLHLKVKNLEKFTEKLNQVANTSISQEDLCPKIFIDLVVSPNNCNFSLCRRIQLLEPFGVGNSKPIIMIKNIKIEKYRTVGQTDKHLKIIFNTGTKPMDSILFNYDKDRINLEIGRSYDIVFYPEINYWNGRESISLKLMDIKPNEK